MQSSNKKPNLSSAPDVPNEQISANIGLSLVTGPFLLGIVTGKALWESLLSISEASEEVFRGDRLPVLHFPDREPDLLS